MVDVSLDNLLTQVQLSKEGQATTISKSKRKKVMPQDWRELGMQSQKSPTLPTTFGDLTVSHPILVPSFAPIFPSSGKGKSLNFMDALSLFNEPVKRNPID